MSTEAALKRMEDKIDRNQEGIASNREGIASNREMILENRKVVDQLHQAVIRIEQVHGNKLDALMDGHDVMSNRFHRLEQRMDRQQMRMDGFGQNFARLETGQQEIKQTIEKLVSVVSNHEDRLQKIEMKDGS
jgi:archaellum component FlaC